MKFIDEVRLKIASGRGGPGCVSFRREAFEPRGGPDGGDGGKGGDVILRTSKHLNSLVDFKSNKKYTAQNGQQGGAAKCSGPDGQDLIMMVPEGTLLRDLQGQILVDMTGVHEHVLLRGGRGGKGNHFFRTSVNQAPEYAQPGEEGQEIEVIMELKLIADVGIIGFPNAGKSTLISRISAAKPKIADYPFTTLTPNLGVVKFTDEKSFVVADIPGLVKGAHQGIGLGIQFLKHIERTRVFVHLVDASGVSGRDPYEDYADLNYELQMYDEANKDKEGFFALTSRPQIVALNKTDAVSEVELEKMARTFQERAGFRPLLISAVSGLHIRDLLLKIGEHLYQGDQ
ncbi:MAG: GTPase ObgE [Bdellovibrionales bacterium]